MKRWGLTAITRAQLVMVLLPSVGCVGLPPPGPGQEGSTSTMTTGPTSTTSVDTTLSVDSGGFGLSSTTGSSGSTEPQTTDVSDLDSSTSIGDETTTGEAPALDCSDPNLVACYDFNGVGAGVLFDLSMNGNDASAVVASVVPGPFGEAATFDDSSEVLVEDNSTLDLIGAVTVEAWLRPDDLPSLGERMGVLDNNSQYALMIYSNGTYRCALSGIDLFGGPIALGEWSHVACVHNPDTQILSLYVNGVEVSSGPSAGRLNTDNEDPIAIGDESPTFSEPLIGAIGGLRIWRDVRTAEDLCNAAGRLCAG